MGTNLLEQVPGDLGHITISTLQGLIDRHCAHRDRTADISATYDDEYSVLGPLAVCLVSRLIVFVDWLLFHAEVRNKQHYSVFVFACMLTSDLGTKLLMSEV